ncbi:MAG TPA: DinB family protein [Ktedonobacterales bacterium]
METMDTSWSTAIWQQFGAAIDMFDNALVACPAALWREHLWSDPPDHPQPPLGEFWFIAYHTLYWLDLYLSSVAASPSGVTPPSPFPTPALDADDDPPERPYAKEELRAYLAYTKQKCRSTIETMTDEWARCPYEFPWEKGQGRPISYLELLLYTMRHVQEHAAQLSLFLGQHGIPDADLDWVPRVQDGLGDR